MFDFAPSLVVIALLAILAFLSVLVWLRAKLRRAEKHIETVIETAESRVGRSAELLRDATAAGETRAQAALEEIQDLVYETSKDAAAALEKGLKPRQPND